MKCFQYNLNKNNEGPAGRLPPLSITGLYTDGVYYGAALIDDLDVIADWNPVEVTPLEFNTICAQTSTEENPNPVPPLTQLEQAIRLKFSQQMESVVSPYLPEERETWFIQVEEAKKYVANNNIDSGEIPLITTLAEVRGESLDLVTSWIIQKNTEYRTAVGNILGQQQKLISQIWET